jgi:hypothetical protein
LLIGDVTKLLLLLLQRDCIEATTITYLLAQTDPA